ncbi:MAG: SRPBCC domain-containing protein [Mucilaginibacter sp.]
MIEFDKTIKLNKMDNKCNSVMQVENILVHKRIFDAPGKLVWDVWTDPGHLQNWWSPEGFSLSTFTMEFKPGKLWNFVIHGKGMDFENKIKYQEIVKPSMFSFEHFDSDKNQSLTVTISFEEADGKTQLTMKSIFKSNTVIDKMNNVLNSSCGAIETLNRLEQYLKNLADII